MDGRGDETAPFHGAIFGGTLMAEVLQVARLAPGRQDNGPILVLVLSWRQYR